MNFGITTGKDFIAICFALLLVSGGHAMAVVAPPEVAFPVSIDSYQDEQIHSLPAKLLNRIQQEPFNLVAAVIFVFAIVHTFLVSKFRTIAHRLQHRYEDLEPLETGQRDDPCTKRRDRLLFGAQFFHFMGEVEAVFGIWLVPLFCQEWWIVPLLGSLSEWPLMIGAVVLGAFNDNAAITYLASLVPNLSDPLKYAVVAGAITGGGLTVIANAPNPAGQSILASRFGESGISAIKLLAGAFVPTLIVGTMFMLFR